MARCPPSPNYVVCTYKKRFIKNLGDEKTSGSLGNETETAKRATNGGGVKDKQIGPEKKEEI